jgi:hypothetical protein
LIALKKKTGGIAFSTEGQFFPAQRRGIFANRAKFSGGPKSPAKQGFLAIGKGC